MTLLVGLSGCGSDSSDGDKKASEPSASETPPEAPSADAAAVPAPPTINGTKGPGEFEFETADGSVGVAGKAVAACVTRGEASLSVVFRGQGDAVRISVSQGTGAVTVTGTSGFEGTADFMELGDDGTVKIAGKGSASDDSSTPTSFAILGNCSLAAPSSPDSSAGAGTPGDQANGARFSLSTQDGSLKAAGAAQRCASPNEETLRLRFTGNGNTVRVNVSKREGTVIVTGTKEFEGTVNDFEVGDDGSLSLSGSGSAADPGSSPTRFTVEGSSAG